MVPLSSPREALFLMSAVPLYCTKGSLSGQGGDKASSAPRIFGVLGESYVRRLKLRMITRFTQVLEIEDTRRPGFLPEA